MTSKQLAILLPLLTMTFLFSWNKKSKKESAEASESKTNNVLAVVSGVSVLVLETLRDVARFAPVPYLSDISSVALGILEAAQVRWKFL